MINPRLCMKIEEGKWFFIDFILLGALRVNGENRFWSLLVLNFGQVLFRQGLIFIIRGSVHLYSSRIKDAYTIEFLKGCMMQKVKADIVSKYLLHKQHLLDTSKANTVLEVIDDIIALHATSAATPYLSLFERMKQFQRGQLDRELYINRNLIRLGSMRRTLFILPTKAASMVFQATRMSEEQSLQILKVWSIPHSEYQRIADSIFTVLKDGPQPIRIIKQAMSPGLIRTIELPAGKNIARMTNVNIVLTVLQQQGKVFSEKFSDPILTRQANRYALIRTLYPSLNLESFNPEEAQIQLVKRYIEVFGPVTENDITWWTGLGKTIIQTALARLETELLPIQIKNSADAYLMLKSDYNKLKRFKGPRALPVLLLPYEDPYLKGYQQRNRLMTTENEKAVYVGGEARPSVMVGGKIVGIWNRVFEDSNNVIEILLFQGLGRSEKNILMEKARLQSLMMTGKEFQVIIKTR